MWQEFYNWFADSPLVAPSSENRLIVRIWTSGKNELHSGQHMGHVSLEITHPNYQCYISLWPEHLATASQIKPYDCEDHQFKEDYAADQSAEGRAPELTMCLYSLNARSIQQHFKQVTRDDRFSGWSLIGQHRLLNQSKGQSCASLAWILLQAGGVYHLISQGFSSDMSVVVTPDALAEAIKAAKRAECQRYPQVLSKSYYYATETPLAKLNQSYPLFIHPELPTTHVLFNQIHCAGTMSVGKLSLLSFLLECMCQYACRGVIETQAGRWLNAVILLSPFLKAIQTSPITALISGVGLLGGELFSRKTYQRRFAMVVNMGIVLLLSELFKQPIKGLSLGFLMLAVSLGRWLGQATHYTYVAPNLSR